MRTQIMLVKKLILLTASSEVEEKLWKQKPCSFLGLGFLFSFIYTRSFTVIKTLRK